MDYRALWRGRAAFTVLVARFDAAAYEALAALWRDDPQRSGHLHYIAIADAPMPGFRRMPQRDARCTLDLLGAAPAAALAQLDAQIDAANLRGLPIDAGLARALARLCARGAVVECNGEAAAALTAAGFTINTASADTAGARASAANATGNTTADSDTSNSIETNSAAAAPLQATYTSRKPPRTRASEPVRRAIVIGAGLAGCAASERLCARGWHVTLIERHAAPAMEASGNLAGIFMPLLSMDDNVPTRLARAAYLYAFDYWQQLGGIGIGHAIDGQRCGVLQLARDAAHADVQRAIARAHSYPPDFAEWLDADAATRVAGSTAPNGAWLFRQGGWANPASVCAAMLAAYANGLQTQFDAGTVSIDRVDGRWQVRSADGRVIAAAPVVVQATGAGVFAHSAQLPLAAVRGQVTHLAEGAIAAPPLVLCREAYVTPAYRATHSAGATYDSDADPQLRAASQRENLAKLRAVLDDAGAAANAPLAGRVGFRSVAPDRLPLVGALPDTGAAGGTERLRDVPRHAGLYGLLGYASRGLIWAPLAAELLAAQLNGEALPLETALAAVLDPARFVLRARRLPRHL